MDDIIVREMMQNQVSVVRKIGRRVFTGWKAYGQENQNNRLLQLKMAIIILAVITCTFVFTVSG